MDKLERLQLDVAALITTIAALQYTQVIVASPRIDADGNLVTAPEIIQEIDNALNGVTRTGGKAGTIAIVQLPSERILDHELQRAPFPCEARIIIRIEENQIINRGADGSGRTCAELANDIFTALQYYSLAGAILKADDRQTKAPEQYRDGVLAYDLVFSVVWERSALERCRKPVISSIVGVMVNESGGLILQEDGGLIQLESRPDDPVAGVMISSATSGASIYYTTDGSFPHSGNSEATLYSGAFVVDASATIRAVAFKAGMNPSPLAEHSITI